MKKRNLFESYFVKNGAAFDYKRFTTDAGGRVISEASTRNGDVAATLVDLVFGDWKVTLGSATSPKEGEDKNAICDCRSILEVTSATSGGDTYCVYYDKWSPDGDDIIADMNNHLLVPKVALKNLFRLVSSGNLKNRNLECPFKGLGIKHKVVRDGRVVEHKD